ncbi:MAG: hypothetical protein HY361_02125 [Candidatus Aenigmarchaeota archaeon]|nr:hypothetical protein [Candidatus Aenigmarchaeota archaeon]
MQSSITSLQLANRQLRTADHIAYVTFPLIKDNKLIVAVLENLNNAVSNAVDALLVNEKNTRGISIIPEDFELKRQAFASLALKYGISPDEISMISELRNMVVQRKKSQMEFIRKDKYVLWDTQQGKIKELTMGLMKEYLIRVKPFMGKINGALQNVRRI